MTETLAESELFGHTKGAYTGAATERIGKFELADGGTLFLDGIGELPPSVQPKLLRVLQEGEVQKIGAANVKHVDVRILTATNRNLESAVKSGHFRVDLYHRLNVYPLRVPPLRERIDDIPLLAGHFCELAQKRVGSGRFLLSRQTMETLKRYSWPGNVRELENIVTRAVLKTSAGVAEEQEALILTENLDMSADRIPENETATRHSIKIGAKSGLTLREAVDKFTRKYILEAAECKVTQSVPGSGFKVARFRVLVSAAHIETRADGFNAGDGVNWPLVVMFFHHRAIKNIILPRRTGLSYGESFLLWK